MQSLTDLRSELLRFAFTLTADQEDADHLLQAATSQALDNSNMLVPGTDIKRWLYILMRNLYVNDSYNN